MSDAIAAPNYNQCCVGGIDGEESDRPRRIEVGDGWRSRVTNRGMNKRNFLHLILDTRYRYRDYV